MIPKIIHFVWLGKGSKPSTFPAVYRSWQKHASTFEIKEWNEYNADEFDLPNYYTRTYNAQHYAFASDVLRFHVLEKYGGIYLDVDEILLKSIDTVQLLDQRAFLGKYHESEKYFGFGAIGSTPHSTFTQQMIAYYQNVDTKDYVIVNKEGSRIALKLKDESPSDITFLPQEYFYPLRDEDVSPSSYGKHLANTSWIPNWRKFLHKLPLYTPIKAIVMKILPKKVLRRIHY